MTIDASAEPHRMLEPVRQYGLRALTAAGKEACNGDRHARHSTERGVALVDDFEAER
jgi:hypothetical protein